MNDGHRVATYPVPVRSGTGTPKQGRSERASGQVQDGRTRAAHEGEVAMMDSFIQRYRRHTLP